MSRFRSYNEELLIQQQLIGNVFNDIVIERRTHQLRDYSLPVSVTDILQKKFEIPCIYGDRGTIYKSLENEAGQIKYPLFILQSKNIASDTQRMDDIHSDYMYQPDEQFSKLSPDNPLYKKYSLQKRRALPITIDYTLTMLQRYKEDLDQMFTNWTINFRPDIYVKWWHPRNKEKPLESEIIWNQNINYDQPQEQDGTKLLQYSATSDFVFKTWIFPGMDYDQGKDDEGDDIIIHFNYYPLISYSDDDSPSSINNKYTNREGFPVLGEIYNTENAGIFAVDNKQDFINDGSDVEGILKGKYFYNNLTNSPSNIIYDKVSGIPSGQTMIKDLTQIGDLYNNLAVQRSYPIMDIYQSLLSMDNIKNDDITVFKQAYFKKGFPSGEITSSTPQSEDLFFNIFNPDFIYNDDYDENYDEEILKSINQINDEFGTTYCFKLNNVYSYDVNLKTLSISLRI